MGECLSTRNRMSGVFLDGGTFCLLLLGLLLGGAGVPRVALLGAAACCCEELELAGEDGGCCLPEEFLQPDLMGCCTMDAATLGPVIEPLCSCGSHGRQVGLSSIRLHLPQGSARLEPLRHFTEVVQEPADSAPRSRSAQPELPPPEDGVSA